MQPKTNKLTVILTGVLVVVLLLGLIAKFAGNASEEQAGGQAQGDEDTPSESLSALSAQVAQLQAELDRKDSDEAARTASIEARSRQELETLKKNLESKSASVSTSFNQKLTQLQSQLSQLTQGGGSAVVTGGELVDGYIWNEVASGVTAPGLSNTSNANFGLPEDEGQSIPVYTIPVNSTLMESTGMTALIGRVPVGGNVSNPIPFKVITGRKALIANGYDLPEVEEAIWYGFATGDVTLSCVSGRISSVTFVFTDGTIQTVGEDSFSDSIGWISNNRGVQCIPGKYVSNAPKVMAQLFVAGTATGFANATAQSQVTTTAGGTGGITSSLTGDSLDFALGRGLGVGFQEWASYVRERARDQFDAVVVQPGADLAIHVQREIPIDYQTQGRRVRYQMAGYTAPLGVD